MACMDDRRHRRGPLINYISVSMDLFDVLRYSRTIFQCTRAIFCVLKYSRAIFRNNYACDLSFTYDLFLRAIFGFCVRSFAY